MTNVDPDPDDDEVVIPGVDDPRLFVRMVGGMVDELETDLQFYDLAYEPEPEPEPLPLSAGVDGQTFSGASRQNQIQILLTRRSDVVDRLFDGAIESIPAVSMRWGVGSTHIALHSGSVGVDAFESDMGVLNREVGSIHAAIQTARDHLISASASASVDAGGECHE